MDAVGKGVGKQGFSGFDIVPSVVHEFHMGGMRGKRFERFLQRERGDAVSGEGYRHRNIDYVRGKLNVCLLREKRRADREK